MPPTHPFWAAGESTVRFIEGEAQPSLPNAEKSSAGLEPCQPARRLSLQADIWPRGTSFTRSAQSIAAASTVKPRRWQVVIGNQYVLPTSTASPRWHFLRSLRG